MVGVRELHTISMMFSWKQTQEQQCKPSETLSEDTTVQVSTAYHPMYNTCPTTAKDTYQPLATRAHNCTHQFVEMDDHPDPMCLALNCSDKPCLTNLSQMSRPVLLGLPQHILPHTPPNVLLPLVPMLPLPLLLQKHLAIQVAALHVLPQQLTCLVMLGGLDRLCFMLILDDTLDACPPRPHTNQFTCSLDLSAILTVLIAIEVKDVSGRE